MSTSRERQTKKRTAWRTGGSMSGWPGRVLAGRRRGGRRACGRNLSDDLSEGEEERHVTPAGQAVGQGKGSPPRLVLLREAHQPFSVEPAGQSVQCFRVH